MLIKGTITTRRDLLTHCWSADVATVDEAVQKFAAVRDVTNDCGISFFEMEGDRSLHVNVCHRHKTATAKGWSGPATMDQGFVHNRTFTDGDPELIVRDIRSMVFSPRLKNQSA
jgi:hypothetical protein